MSLNQQQTSLLARSLFPLFFVMLLTSGFASLYALITSSEGLRPLALAGFSLLMCYLFLRQDEATLTSRLTRSLSGGRLMLLSLVAAAGVLLTVGLLLLAPVTAFTAVLWSWVCLWSLLLLALHWGGVRRALRWLNPIFSGVGVLVIGIALFEGGLRVVERLDPPPDASIQDVDFQPQLFTTITDVEVEWAAQYWNEYQLASREIVWTPYVYWRMSPFDGEYININEQGIRYTPPPQTPAELTVHVYGGSTVWGQGARDAHTIPGELVTAFAAQGIGAQVTNFGELGYISRQDATLFDLQLAQGNIPDVAIFYWGFNDVNSAFGEGYIGLTSSEKERGAQFEGVQCVLDLSLPVLFNAGMYESALGERIMRALERPPINPAEGCALGNPDWEGVNPELVAQRTTDPAALADQYAHLARYIGGLADAYGVRVVFVWQPTIFLKNPLSWYEQQIVGQGRFDDFATYYRAVDEAVRAEMQGQSNFLLWGDFVWETDPRTNIYIDRVHITEEGNALIAAALVDYLAE